MIMKQFVFKNMIFLHREREGGSVCVCVFLRVCTGEVTLCYKNVYPRT